MKTAADEGGELGREGLLPAWVGYLVPSVAVLFAIGIAVGTIPFGGPGWTPVGYRTSLGLLHPMSIGLGALALTVAVVLSAKLRAQRAVVLLVVMGILSVVINLSLHRPVDHSWTGRLLFYCSAQINPFFMQGIEGAASDPRGYPEKHREILDKGYASVAVREHRLTTYPPGLPMLYGVAGNAVEWFGIDEGVARLGTAQARGNRELSDLPIPADSVTTATATLALAVQVVLLALLPCLTYLVVQALNGSDSSGKRAACVSLFVPSFWIYACTPNILLPILAILAVLAAAMAVSRRSIGWTFGTVAILTVGFMFSYAMAPIVLICFLLIIAGGNASRSIRLRLLAAWCVAAGALWVLLLLCGFAPFGDFARSMANNREFYEISGRDYGPALGWNIVQFAIFSGIVWPVLALAGFCMAVVRLRITGWGNAAVTRQLTLIGGATIILIWLSGGARGEVDRNWMAFMSLLPIFVASEFRVSDRCWRAWFAGAAICVFVISCSVEAIFAFV